MKSLYRLYKGSWIFKEDPHCERKLTNDEVSALLSKGGYMVRNTYDFDCAEETEFYYVIKRHFGGFEELSSKMRNQVRRCFKTMTVKKISSDLLLSEGYDVYQAAAENYSNNSNVPSKVEFEDRVNRKEENEFWGCFDIVTGKLVAFSMNAVTDESCEFRTMKAIPEYQKQYAYYGLIYEMNRYYLEERGLKYVNDGARSITNHSNIQPFLIDKFNFRKAYCRLNIYYKWWLGIAIKILYPFRKLISNATVKAVLNIEAMARGDY